MLEGSASGPELAALSLPPSPRFGNPYANLHSRQSSWLQPSTVPSLASSRPVTPHAGAVGGLSRLACSASATRLVGSSSSLPSRDQLVACVPPSAWHVPATAATAAQASASAPAAVGGRTAPLLSWSSGDSSVHLPMEEHAAPTEAGAQGSDPTRSGRRRAQEHSDQGQQVEGQGLEHCEQGQLMSGSFFQDDVAAEPSLQGRPAALQGSRPAMQHSSTAVSLNVWQSPGPASDTPGSKAGFTAWQSPASPFRQEAGGSPAACLPRQPASGNPAAEAATPVQAAGGGGASGSATPRLASLIGPIPAAKGSPLPEGSPQVTPRQQSLLGCSPRAQVGLNLPNGPSTICSLPAFPAAPPS